MLRASRLDVLSLGILLKNLKNLKNSPGKPKEGTRFFETEKIFSALYFSNKTSDKTPLLSEPTKVQTV